MSQLCDICEKEYKNFAYLDHGKVLCAASDGSSAWACGDCMAAPALAAKYKKALEGMCEKLIRHLDNLHCCDCDLRWTGKDWRDCAHTGEECSFKEMRDCALAAEAALKGEE